MSDNMYNPNKLYNEDETFTVPGRVMNSISKRILDARAEVKKLKDAKMLDELEELRIRDKNPAVKDAWDQYKTVLGLAQNK